MIPFLPSSLIDQFFGGTFDIEMKCTESEEEKPTFTHENFLQLSCFISQEVKYMLSGIKSVSDTEMIRFIWHMSMLMSLQSMSIYFGNTFLETARAAHKAIANFGTGCCLCSNRKCYN